MDDINREAISLAAERISPYIRLTPVISVNLDGRKHELKLECLQLSGTFKARGAFNRLITHRDQANSGVAAASGGNHGIAVATAARALGVPANIYVPGVSPPAKRARLASLGATVTVTGKHYADAAADIEFRFPFGFKELEGIHSRTDFDLSKHQEFSGKKLQYFDTEENKNYVPYVVETSIGLDRMFLAVFSNSLQEETLENGSTRTVLKLPAVLAPTKAAVFPLVKKDGLPELAKEIIEDLKWDFNVLYDQKDAVGRRYRRQDANGTPFCITVDHQSLEDQTVTIRHRDTMEQQRVAISDVKSIIHKEVDMKAWLAKMEK